MPDPLEIRVGIESGEAATGTGPEDQVLVTGSVVNSAARLQAAAAPGEVLVGATTRNLTDAAVTFGDERQVEAKGFAQPLAAAPVEGLSTRSVRRTIPFVGRDDELAMLRQSFSRVIATSTPLLFTIVGEPGIGKSRLAAEFLAGLDPEGTVLVGRSHIGADSATFAPAAAMVRAVAGVEEEDTTDVAIRAAARAHRPASAMPGTDAHTANRLQALVGLSEPRRDESAFVNDVRSGFLALLEGLSSQRPVTLLFEDAHTLRPQMLDLIERIAARGRRGPGRVLVLVHGAHRAARGTSRVGNRRHEPGLRTPRAAARGRGRRAGTAGRWRPARCRPRRDRRRAARAATPSSSWNRPACCCGRDPRRTARP